MPWVSKMLLAAIGGDKGMVCMTSTLELEAAEGADEKTPRKFRMNAYNGGAMHFPWSDVPVVVDLAGMDIPAVLPVLLGHDHREIVGHADSIANDGSTINLAGIVSGAGRAAREVVASSDAGFPWQSSIGAKIIKVDRIAKGSVNINNRTFNGPILVVSKSKLAESSFVPLGADDTSSASTLAAFHQHPNTGGLNMDFEKWLKAQGFDVESLTDAQITVLRAAYDAEGAQNNGSTPPSNDDALKAYREAMGLEAKRVADIQKLCAAGHQEIAATAISEGWDTTKVELEVLRASRSAPNINQGRSNGPVGADILEAAAAQSLGMQVDDLYAAEALDAAHQRYHSRISLQELLLEAAWANGYVGHSVRGDLRGILTAAFSSRDISGILSNLANKSMLSAFLAVEQAWRQIADVSPVSDFKTHTRYRLIGDDQYELVPPDGEIRHGTLGEDSHTIKADTYAKMFGIGRADIINDDLGILQTVPRKLGRGAGTKLNELFWSTFLNNATFFAAGNKNYFAGATSALSLDSLAKADEILRDQVDHEGHPLGISGQILLTPNALRIKANQLVNSTEVRSPSAKEPTGNPFAGQLTVVSSAYLGNVTYDGASTAAWYLLTNPADLATIEVAFLNGQQAPTIESASADFDRLGIQMRGYHDFGVALQEYRAGVKSKGAA